MPHIQCIIKLWMRAKSQHDSQPAKTLSKNVAKSEKFNLYAGFHQLSPWGTLRPVLQSYIAAHVRLKQLLAPLS